MIGAVISFVLDTLFPRLCLSCRKHLKTSSDREHLLCTSCCDSIGVSNSFFCPKCKGRLPTKRRCHPKEKYVLAAASSYTNDVIRALIHALKYEHLESAAVPIDTVVGRYIHNTAKQFEPFIKHSVVVIPMPLHRKRERSRGFNQAALIAEIIIKHLRMEYPEHEILYDKKSLVRVKHTESQIKFENYEKRKENVSGCFSLISPESVAGKSVILVDDVFTSGATMQEAVRVLKEAGTEKIIGFVIARA